MVTLQILNKILKTKDPTLLTRNGLEKEQFIGYENEFQYIVEHLQKYKVVPDKETFIDKFNDFELIEVQESDEYLLDTLNEENLYYKSVSVVQKVAELLKTNSNDAVEYLQSEIPNLQLTNISDGTDIIGEGATERLKVLLEKRNSEESWYITTGFKELDEMLNGWSKGEELVVIFARTGQGKSWLLVKSLTEAWKSGENVGYISPEMSPTKIGYRFDTVSENFSNKALVWGEDVPDYENYIDGLKANENKFIVATPGDFQKKVTVSKLKQFCIVNKLDIIGVDGITYMTDERYKKGDNKTTSLTNISEDLFAMSLELGIPVVVVVQSNRQGVIDEGEEGTPELEAIRDSDGIAQNASKVISLRQTGAGLELGIKKHRDGESDGKLIYFWDINTGKFKYIPSFEDSVNNKSRDIVIEENRETFNDETDVF